jgi:hypothetical protein
MPYPGLTLAIALTFAPAVAPWIVAPARAASATEGAASAGPPRPAPTGSAVALARYPQPLRVGELTGRLVLEDVSQLRVLGRVARVTGGDGGTRILVDCCGLFGFGTRRVALPVATTLLLGQFVVARNLDGRGIAALPPAPPPSRLLPADAVIEVGLWKN